MISGGEAFKRVSFGAPTQMPGHRRSEEGVRMSAKVAQRHPSFGWAEIPFHFCFGTEWNSLKGGYVHPG